MGKPKKYDIRSINFGEVGNPARYIIKEYCEKYGKNELSRLIRKLVLIYFSDNPEYKKWKIYEIIYEKKKIGQNIAKLIKKRSEIHQELEKLGINPDEII